MRLALFALLTLLVSTASAQATFDVASIHASTQPVKFERDGEMDVGHGTIRMHDVTVSTCIKWAYQVQQAQIIPLAGMDDIHYDIVAKTSLETTSEEMRAMMQSLLAERFGLRFHHARKEVNAYALTVAPGGLKKMKSSALQDGVANHQNSAIGMVAHNFTMQDFVSYVSGPLGAPLVDETNLPGEYDFEFDFRPYVDQTADIHADPTVVLRRTFEGELGLRMIRRHAVIDTMVIEHVAAPSEN